MTDSFSRGGVQEYQTALVQDDLMNVAISRKRPRLLYALVVALPLTAQAEETVVVTASPPASASAPTEGYSASTSLGATKTDQPLITTAQSVSVVTRQQMADQGRIPSARRWNIPRGLLQLRRRRDPVRRYLPARLPRRRRR